MEEELKKTEKTDGKLNKPYLFQEGFDPRRNLVGRPKGAKSFTTKVKEALEKVSDGKETTYEEELVKTVLEKAIQEKDQQMIKLIWNYLDGMPAQKIEYKEDKTEDELTPLVDQLKTKDEKQRAKIIEHLKAIDEEWSQESALCGGLADVDNRTDIPTDTESKELEVGEATPRVE